MKNPYLNKIDSDGKIKEDDTTEILAELLADFPEILSLYLRFLFSKYKNPPNYNTDEFQVFNQYDFKKSLSTLNTNSIGILDLVLISEDDDLIVGVEYKIDDGEKPDRLKHYKNHLKSVGFKNVYLFEVLKRTERSYSSLASFLDGLFTWNELYDFIKNKNLSFKDDLAFESLSHFIELLEKGNVLVQKGKSTKKKRRAPKGFPQLHEIEHYYKYVQDEFPEYISSIQEPAGEPCVLKMGSSQWDDTIGPLGQEIVSLTAQISNKTSAGVFFYTGILFHRDEHSKISSGPNECFVRNVLPIFGNELIKSNFEIWASYNWSSQKNFEVKPPFLLDNKMKYLYANEIKEKVNIDAFPKTTIDCSNFMVVIERVRKTLSQVQIMIDKFRSTQ
tara:strand:- start:231 stop:1397 length:1167 start_codon:yes stop_codon:yes gene_type:complete